MNQTTNTTPKDFFIHLGALVTLYTGVIALINLSFSIINYYFPDSLAGYFYTNSIAWPISILVVVTPILYFLEWYIVKDNHLNPDKIYLWIRRWGIFLTLFLTGVIMAGDLITLINTYLNGEISARFVWKVFAVLVISATVFKYYFFTINTRYGIAAFARTFHAWLGIVLVIAAIVAGFVTVGSPTKQRNLRFDNQRVSDLQNIQWQIVNYWQQKGKLPNTLAEVIDPISGNTIPTDPEKKTPYGYTKKSDRSFEICGTFTLAAENNQGKGSYDGGLIRDSSYYPPVSEDENWKYEAGNTCFIRIIDPERYPPYVKNPIAI